MNEFQTIEGITNLFRQVNCLGNQNCFFYAITNKTKMMSGGFLGGMAAGMEATQNNRNWDGYLINSNEYGIGLIPLKNTNALLSSNMNTMNVQLDKFIFINKANIESIKIRKVGLISPVARYVDIKITGAVGFELMVYNKYKELPYQEANFAQFVQANK